MLGSNTSSEKIMMKWYTLLITDPLALSGQLVVKPQCAKLVRSYMHAWHVLVCPGGGGGSMSPV